MEEPRPKKLLDHRRPQPGRPGCPQPCGLASGGWALLPAVRLTHVTN
jgi:hypothetical protein